MYKERSEQYRLGQIVLMMGDEGVALHFIFRVY